MPPRRPNEFGSAKAGAKAELIPSTLNMKSKQSFTLSLVAAALLGGFTCTAVTSCQGMITKQDVTDLSKTIVTDGLSIATAKLTGQPIDINLALTQLGAKVAFQAVAKIEANINSPASATTPEQIVTQAFDQAKKDIATAGPDPQTTSLALQLVDNAANKAVAQLITIPGGKVSKAVLPQF